LRRFEVETPYSSHDTFTDFLLRRKIHTRPREHSSEAFNHSQTRRTDLLVTLLRGYARHQASSLIRNNLTPIHTSLLKEKHFSPLEDLRRHLSISPLERELFPKETTSLDNLPTLEQRTWRLLGDGRLNPTAFPQRQSLFTERHIHIHHPVPDLGQGRVPQQFTLIFNHNKVLVTTHSFTSL